jgi:preprotein translocase subunit SecG
MGGLMSSRGTANFLTRTTAILAGAFMATSLALALLSESGGGRSIVDEVERAAPTAPAQTPAAPAAPATPSVPLSK